MENKDDNSVLQSKVKSLTEQLNTSKAESAKLKQHLIGLTIRKNEVFKNRVLDVAGVAHKLTDHFMVDVTSNIPRVKSKEKVVSLLHGLTDNADNAVTELLQGRYKGDLLPEQPPSQEAERKGGEKVSQPKADATLAKLKAEYEAAKGRSDGKAMIALKRRLAQAGHACQSALKIDPPSASKIDPPQAVVF